MDKVEFLEAFKKHCQMALDSGLYNKEVMLGAVRNRDCPFECHGCPQVDHKWSGGCPDCRVSKVFGLVESYDDAANTYRHVRKPSLFGPLEYEVTEDMLQILESVETKVAGKP